MEFTPTAGVLRRGRDPTPSALCVTTRYDSHRLQNPGVVTVGICTTLRAIYVPAFGLYQMRTRPMEKVPTSSCLFFSAETGAAIVGQT